MNRCPICFADTGPPLLVRDRVPAFLNRPYMTAEAAREAPTGKIEFAFCHHCEFGFNAAFDPSLTAYDDAYENEQSHSPTVRKHLERVIDRAVSARGARTGPVVEIGCGQGDFLRRFAARLENATLLVGMDPCCRVPADAGGRIRFARSTLDGIASEDLPRDPSLVYSRHVIEHVPGPVGFLKEWTRGLVQPGTPILLETPSLEWIVHSSAFMDLVYEHCNYFSARSLQRILPRAGFQLRSIDLVFESQYFLIEAWKEYVTSEDSVDAPAIGQAVEEFCEAEPRLTQSWLTRLTASAQKGPVCVWGAGAKGVSFVTLLDPSRQLVDCLIDVNPAKQGRFIPVTAHEIVSPETACGRGMITAFVMNPNYVDEIRARVTALGTPVELISFKGSMDEIHD